MLLAACCCRLPTPAHVRIAISTSAFGGATSHNSLPPAPLPQLVLLQPQFLLLTTTYYYYQLPKLLLLPQPTIYTAIANTNSSSITTALINLLLAHFAANTATLPLPS
jgi:hypothetical protein